MAKTWIYGNNFVLTATKGSIINALKISAYHLAALHVASSDPALLAMYNKYLPLDTSLNTAYNNWSAQTGTKKGSTLSYAEYFNNLTINLNDWDSAVQRVFRKDSPSYLALFPQGHRPFQNGSQDNRKAAVSTFATNLGNYPALAALKTTVTDYLTALNAAHLAKNEALQNSKNLKDTLLAAIDAMAKQQFTNYGTLIGKYINTLTKIGTFFDLKNIRSHKQTDFSRKVGVNKLVHIVRRTLAPDDKIRIINTGDAKLRFYFATSKTADAGPLHYDSEPGSNAVILASTLGDMSTDHFLNVFNLADLQEGLFELELM